MKASRCVASAEADEYLDLDDSKDAYGITWDFTNLTAGPDPEEDKDSVIIPDPELDAEVKAAI